MTRPAHGSDRPSGHPQRLLRIEKVTLRHEGSLPLLRLRVADKRVQVVQVSRSSRQRNRRRSDRPTAAGTGRCPEGCGAGSWQVLPYQFPSSGCGHVIHQSGLDDVEQVAHQALALCNLLAASVVQQHRVTVMVTDQLDVVQQQLDCRLRRWVAFDVWKIQRKAADDIVDLDQLGDLLLSCSGYRPGHHAFLSTKAPAASIAASQGLTNSPAATAQPSIPAVNRFNRPAMTTSSFRAWWRTLSVDP